MTDRKINKWLRKQFSPIGWVLIGYYFLLNILVTAQAVIDMMGQMLWNLAVGDSVLNLNMDELMNNAWGYAVTIAVGLVILYAWKGRDFWNREMFAREGTMTWGVIFCCTCFLLGSQMVNSFWLTALELIMNGFGSSILPTLESVSGSTESFSMFLYSALLAPLSEEIIFRGYVLRSLRPYGKRFAIWGSALLFALFHGNLLQGPYAFLAGLIFGYLACNYSILWAIGLHMFNNLLLAEGLSRLMEYLPQAAADGIHLALFGGALVLSVGILRRKRQEIAYYRRGEWIDRRCVKTLLTSPGIVIFSAMMLLNMAAWLAA